MRRIKKLGVVGGATVVLVAGGVAYAGWLSSGTGDASGATAGTSLPLVVNAGSSATGLVPTVDKIVNPTVTNPNPYPVKIKTISVNSVTAGSPHAGNGCDVSGSDASAVEPVQTTIDAWPTIPAGGTSGAIPITVKLGLDSDNACQGATFTVNFTATAESSN